MYVSEDKALLISTALPTKVKPPLSSNVVATPVTAGTCRVMLVGSKVTVRTPPSTSETLKPVKVFVAPATMFEGKAVVINSAGWCSVKGISALPCAPPIPSVASTNTNALVSELGTVSLI